MKNSLKVSLTTVFLAVVFGVALTFCGTKPEQPADTQDTAKVEVDSAAQTPVDSAAQEAPQDSAAAQ